MTIQKIVCTALFFAAAGLIFGTAAEAEAGLFRKSNSRSYSYSSSTPKAITGYGSNLHRRFVIKQEQQRASKGYTVRNRGNVLWVR